MSCVETVCGTGGWTGPKPGDPDNNVLLSANCVFGGIEVSWTYPVVYPHAVAHTLLYRGVTNVFDQAAQRGVVAGSIFFDKLDVLTNTQYYYWIQVVSVNGTVGETIGPVSAIAVPIGEQTIEKISERINEGVLAQSLRTSIANITVIGQDLLREIQDRLDSNLALQAALTAVQSETGEALTYILNEVSQRITADSAMVSSINAISAGLAGNAAALVEERTVRVTKDDALTQSISTLNATFNSNIAAIINTQTTQANAQSTLAQSVTQNYAEFGANKATTSNKLTALASADDVLARDISTLFVKSTEASAAINEERTARINQAGITAQKVDTASATLYGNTATGEVGLTSKITTLDGKVTGIGSLYTVKANVNGLIGGFGTYNDGQTVQGGWDVDSFWVGRPNEGGVRPFTIHHGTVYIDKARIRDADIDTLKIKDNAVTVPVGISSSGVDCGTYLYLSVAGSIYVSYSANLAAYDSSACSVAIRVYCDGVLGASIGLSLYDGYSGAGTVGHIFKGIAAGWHYVAGTSETAGGGRHRGAMSLFAVGCQR